MAKSWLPLRDAELLAFCSAFSGHITAAPTDFGLVIGDATALDALVTSYGDGLAQTNDPATRTSVTVATKQMAREALIASMRLLYKKIIAANLTPDKLEALGLPIRDTEPTPIPPPAMSPTITIVSRNENTVTIQLSDPTEPTRRGRPPGVDGMAIFSFVGEVAPTTEAGWKFEMNTTRMRIDLPFPATVTPGSKVWLTAFFFNPRAESGPAATPVSTHLPGGAAMAA